MKMRELADMIRSYRSSLEDAVGRGEVKYLDVREVVRCLSRLELAIERYFLDCGKEV